MGVAHKRTDNSYNNKYNVIMIKGCPVPQCSASTLNMLWPLDTLLKESVDCKKLTCQYGFTAWSRRTTTLWRIKGTARSLALRLWWAKEWGRQNFSFHDSLKFNIQPSKSVTVVNAISDARWLLGGFCHVRCF